MITKREQHNRERMVRIERYLALRAQNLTYTEIGRQEGTSEAAVRRLLTRAGYHTPSVRHVSLPNAPRKRAPRPPRKRTHIVRRAYSRLSEAERREAAAHAIAAAHKYILELETTPADEVIYLANGRELRRVEQTWLLV